MTKNHESKTIPPMFADERAQEWMEAHLTELKQSVSGQRFLYQSLVVGFVLGLAAHVGGYAVLSSQPGGLLGLLADLLHALGWSLWTGVVVAVFVEILPEIKRRQVKQAVEEYDAWRREHTTATDDRDAVGEERPHTRTTHGNQNRKRRR